MWADCYHLAAKRLRGVGEEIFVGAGCSQAQYSRYRGLREAPRRADFLNSPKMNSNCDPCASFMCRSTESVPKTNNSFFFVCVCVLGRAHTLYCVVAVRQRGGLPCRRQRKMGKKKKQIISQDVHHTLYNNPLLLLYVFHPHSLSGLLSLFCSWIQCWLFVFDCDNNNHQQKKKVIHRSTTSTTIEKKRKIL